ncbi:MAG: putative transport system permease protein [Acidimicrobiaceae bacterium]|nr:putative transport system permease protein [Acidimicrobiaceae bacterium]
MFTLTVSSVRANKSRFVLTALAVLLGVAFMAGTFVLTDTIKQSYDSLSANVYRGTNALVRSGRTTTSSDLSAMTTRGSVGASTLAAVRGTAGVALAEPQQLGVAVVVGKDGRLLDSNKNRAAPIALAWQDSPRLNPMRLVSGHAPVAADDIVIDVKSAKTGKFQAGDQVRVVSAAGAGAYRIAGIATYGGTSSAAGAQVVAFTPATAGQVFGTPDRFSGIQVVAAPGVSQTQLVSNLRAAVHDTDIDIITGTKAAAEDKAASKSSLGFISMFLLTFAVVALVVGSFVIYNTFSVTLAQRTKETAMLRAIGARRRQVLRAIRLEALFTGVVASALGAVAGVGLAQVLRSVMTAFGVELPSGATVVQPRTFIVSILTGVVVTYVAAWLPARRAAKVAPIAALRDAAVDGSSRSRRRMVTGAVITVLGALLLAQGLSGAGIGPVALGVLFVFVGVAVLGPVIAGRFSRIVGAPLPRMRGVAGELARDNAVRNPRRTAATSSALMVSIGLVVFITVFAASAKASISTSVDKAMRTDFIVATQFGMGGLSPSVAQRIDALPETGVVTPLRTFDAKVGGIATPASAVDPARAAEGVTLGLREGDFNQLGLNGVAVRSDVAKHAHLHLGDTVKMFFAERGERPFTVVAIYATNEPLGDYVLSIPAYDANFTAHADTYVVVSRAPGFSKTQTRQAVERVLKDFPTAQLMTRQEFSGSMLHEISKTLNLIYVLLAMAVVIALFGIANTLALSVFERTREIGMLRAIGMSRSQVRSAVRWESVLIALLGTSLGSVIGLSFGYALAQALKDKGFNTFAVPVVQLAGIVVLAALAAVLAASRPASRAAKVNILAAIKTI